MVINPQNFNAGLLAILSAKALHCVGSHPDFEASAEVFTSRRALIFSAD